MRVLRHACQTADEGLAFACRGSFPASAPLTTVPVNVAGAEALIGFTSPATTYNRMAALQADAAETDANVQAHVPKSSPFYAAWTAWYRDNWTPFYTRYASPDYSVSDRFKAMFSSDGLAEQELSYERQYNALRLQYGGLRDANGQPLPQSQPHTADDARGSGAAGEWSPFALPWWFWVGTTVVVGGAGYLVYQKIQQARRTGKYLREHPEIISAVAGPEAGAAIRLQNAVDAAK